MSYEAWRITFQESEQAARAAYQQAQAVSLAADALANATSESEADAALEAIEAATGQKPSIITENIIQSFLISYNTHPKKNEFLSINGYFDWWKANRRGDKQQAENQHIPPINEGYERQWYSCQACNAVTYRDYIPYSLSNPILEPACGHWFEDLQAISEQQAIQLMKATQ